MKDYFTVNELAEYFGVCLKTIYRRLWATNLCLTTEPVVAALHNHAVGCRAPPNWKT